MTLTLVPPDGDVPVIGSKKRTGYGRAMPEDEGPARDVQCCDCSAPMQVSAFVWELAKLASSALTNRGQHPLGNDEITRCKACVPAWEARMLARSIELEDKIGRLYALAKTTGGYPSEAKRWLLDHGHFGDVRQLNDICKAFGKGDGDKPKGGKRRDR